VPRFIIGRQGSYVDPGSADWSLQLAQRLGIEIVLLDITPPFTSTRARNAGFQCLQRLLPEIGYLQFVDGGCEVSTGWSAKVQAFLH
jgi:hypothetical protein